MSKGLTQGCWRWSSREVYIVFCWKHAWISCKADCSPQLESGKLFKMFQGNNAPSHCFSASDPSDSRLGRMLEAGVQANEAPRLIPDSSFKLVVGI